MSETEYEIICQLTMVTYRGLNCTVPKSPRITVMMWTKLVRIGAHWYPRKSNICRSKMLIWKRETEEKKHKQRQYIDIQAFISIKA